MPSILVLRSRTVTTSVKKDYECLTIPLVPIPQLLSPGVMLLSPRTPVQLPGLGQRRWLVRARGHLPPLRSTPRFTNN